MQYKNLQRGQNYKIEYHQAGHAITTICKGAVGRMILLGGL